MIEFDPPLGELVAPNISDTMSIAIRQALDDLEKAEACDNLRVNMEYWHSMRMENGPCYVCLAGSVISAAGNDARRIINPYDFFEDDNEITFRKLLAFDFLRKGDYEKAMFSFGIPTPKINEVLEGFPLELSSYHINPVQFKNDLRTFADHLERHGL
mgnify:CR=1 FL=1